MVSTPYSPLVEQIIQAVNRLTPDAQQKILNFTSALMPRGVPGKDLLRFAGTIAADDLELMTQAIEAECERIDVNEW